MMVDYRTVCCMGCGKDVTTKTSDFDRACYCKECVSPEKSKGRSEEYGRKHSRSSQELGHQCHEDDYSEESVEND